MKEREIPLLTLGDIDCRVQSVKESKTGKVGATLLLYKDARVDMRILDQVYGVGNWQRTHEVLNGNLFCTIELWDEEKKCWVKKQDVGVESNTEKEKGQASDAFKRAGFNVGIGRELYTAPFVYVELTDDEYYTDKDGKIRASTSLRFSVSQINYNEKREIIDLKIKDKKGRIRYSMNQKVEPVKAEPSEGLASEAEKAQIKEICKANNWNMEQILIASGWRKGTKLTQEQYGKVLLVIKNRLELKGEA